MAKLAILKGSTSKLLRVFIQDSSATTGVGLTGLAFNTASLTAYYIREGAASATAITLATMTVGTWATGGFKEVDSTNLPGVYELGIPNAVLAAGADHVLVMLKGAANMTPTLLEIQLTSVDFNDAVRFGLSSLPNASAGANNGLPLGNASGYVTVATNNDKTGYALTQAFPSNFSSLAITGGGAVTAGTVSDKTGYSLSVTPPTAAQVAAVILATPANLLATDGSGRVTAASVAGNVGGNVVGSVGSVTTVNDKTGYALTAGEHTAIATDTQTGLTAQGYTSTRAGYLDTLNGLVAAIWAAGTRSLTTFGTLASDVWAVATRTLTAASDTSGVTTLLSRLTSGRASNLDNLDAAITTRASQTSVDAVDDYVDTEVGAIKTVTDKLSAMITGSAPDYAFDVEALANAPTGGGGGEVWSTSQRDNIISDVSSIKGAVDTEVAAIKAKTDNLPASPAAVGSQMTLNPAQALSNTQTSGTVGEALLAARAQGIGRWKITGDQLAIYAPDNTTIIKTLTLDSTDSPTERS